MFGFAIKNIIIALAVVTLATVHSPAWAQADTRIGLSVEEQNWLNDHPVLKIGVDRAYRPIEFVENGRHRGLAADYLQLLSNKLGVRFEISSTPLWKDTLEALRHKEIDMLSAVYETPQRSQYMIFSDSYLNLETAIITSTHNQQQLSLEDLAGRKVAIVGGYFWEDIIRQSHPSITLVPVPNLSIGLQETAFGSVDAMLTTFATATAYIQQRGITNLRVAGITPYSAQYNIAIRPDWPELKSIINKALATISPQQKQKIEARWVALQHSSSRPVLPYLALIAAACALLFVVLFIGLAWNQVLRRKIKARTNDLKWELAQRKIAEAELKRAKHDLEAKVEERTQRLSDTVDSLINSQQELEQANSKLHEMANNDGLTMIANRRSLDLGLALALASTQEKRLPLTFILGDIDFFKLYNDHYGHQAGDNCLVKVAMCLSQFAKRSGELVARYGGEEFALLLPGLDQHDAAKISTDILAEIAALEIPHRASNISPHISMSLGVVSLIPSGDTQIEDLVRWADQALYQSKRNGRMQVTFYQEQG